VELFHKTNNNLVERLNGTVRERDKVMRGIKKKEAYWKLDNSTKEPSYKKKNLLKWRQQAKSLISTRVEEISLTK